MAESEPAAAEISPIAEPEPSTAATEETVAAPAAADDGASEDPAPEKEPDAPKEEADAVAAPALSEADGTEAVAPDHKRKLDDLEVPRDGEGAPETKQDPSVQVTAAEVPSDEKAPENGEPAPAADAADTAPAKRQRLDDEEADGSVTAAEQESHKSEAPSTGNGQYTSAEGANDLSNVSVPAEQPPPLPIISRKFEVPNNKVGVLIGKAGETIKYLQLSSGAKIQIARDADADPNSSTRPAELTGTPESINKAEHLIKEVIKEAEAGGSPSLLARGFGHVHSGSEQQEIRIPNEKVGSIIGKSGNTIKNLQTQSGALVQLIPQHLPEGDTSKERTVRITGNKRQIETARNIIKDILNQAQVRSSLSGGYRQSRPRGPSSVNQWGSRAPPPAQPGGYDYHQRGTYPPQNAQYHSQPYGGYAQQPPPRNNINTNSWDQRAAAPTQVGGYDYYGKGGQPVDTQTTNSVPAHSPAPANYNYGQSQSTGYGQPTPYMQSAHPSQQSYGQGFSEQKYDNQPQGQQFYGQQQPVNSQPGAYPQQGSAPQVDYSQQQSYNKAAYGSAPQSYGPTGPSQPGDSMYQGVAPSSYGTGVPPQQTYPYGQNVPSQTAPAYGQAYGSASGVPDGYNQPSQAAGYPQHNAQAAPAYNQAGQPAPSYTQQGAPSGGYGQYPSSQPNYGEQPAPNNVNYGYQGGSADAVYGGNGVPAASGYASVPASNQAGYPQAGYTQPQSYPVGYEQQMPAQPGYGS